MPFPPGYSDRITDERQPDQGTSVEQGNSNPNQRSNTSVKHPQRVFGKIMLLSAGVLAFSALWIAYGDTLSPRVNGSKGVLPVVDLGYTWQQATSFNVRT